MKKLIKIIIIKNKKLTLIIYYNNKKYTENFDKKNYTQYNNNYIKDYFIKIIIIINY